MVMRFTAGGRGYAPDAAEGAYSAPANPLVGGEGLVVVYRIAFPATCA